MGGSFAELEEKFVKYTEFRDLIQRELRLYPDGFTWEELRTRLKLPYDRPCQSWLRRMENDISLVRRKGGGRAYVWTIEE